MKKYHYIILQLILFLTLITAQQNNGEYIFPDEKPSIIALTNWRTVSGDSLIFKEVAYDDDHWKEDPGYGLWKARGYDGKGIRWYRKELFFPEPIDSLSTFALYQVAAVTASEIYWDGNLIVKNGEVGEDEESEIAGVSGRMYVIPGGLVTQGKHLISMRISNHSTFSGIIDGPLRFGYLENISGYLFRRQAISIFLAGMFFLTALFHFIILFGQVNKWPYALFATFSLACAGYIIIRGFLKYFQVDLSHYYLMAMMNDVPWLFMMVLLPLFVLYEFDSPYKKRVSSYIIIVGIILVVIPRLITFGRVPVEWLNFFDTFNHVHFNLSIVLSMIIAAWAGTKAKMGSLSAAVGLLIFLIGVMVSRVTGSENAWAIGFAGLDLFLFVSLANQMAHRNRVHHRTELRATSLKLDLLKKQIHPHFLLNSLNSIVAWLEEDPETAATLVNALADELRMLMDFSKAKVISLKDEIKICKAHLRIMGLRHEKDYTLSVNGVKGDEKIPPLIIHTLVENGLTHGYVGRDNGYFELNCEETPVGIKLSLFNDGIVEESDKEVREGGGMKYVRARLEEIFPKKWKLKSFPHKNGWMVELEIIKEEM